MPRPRRPGALLASPSMGRIADAALRLLAAGPRAAGELGDELARAGITHANDPAAAVRRALRDDPRAFDLSDGRVASLAQAFDGLTLTARVDAEAVATKGLPLDGDLAPLALLPIGPRVPLPHDASPGSSVSVRVDAQSLVAPARPLRRVGRRPADEEALLGAVRRHLREGDGLGLAPLAMVVAELAACNPSALRVPGRPLTDVLDRAGYELHLGWVGPRGTAWEAVTRAHAAALDEQARMLLGAEQLEESIELQERLVELLLEHLPDRAPSARRRLARTMARDGRSDAAIRVLEGAFPADDPEDRYEGAVVAHRSGDAVLARRLVEEALARTDSSAGELSEALSDLGADLDAQAAFVRLRAALGRRGDDPEALARGIAELRRSYLVEAAIEVLFGGLSADDGEELVRAIGARCGDAGRDVCLAAAAVLDGSVAVAARDAAGSLARARRPAIAGLIEAYPSAAWITSLSDADDQQQLVVAVAKEEGRVAPLIVLLDFGELQGAVKDAFFLPDTAPVRLRREILDPMDEIGLPAEPIHVGEAIARLRAGLQAAEAIGWSIPSLDAQPVVDRMRRWVLDRGAGENPAPVP